MRKTFVVGWLLVSLSIYSVCFAQESIEENGVTFILKDLNVTDLERFLGISTWKFTYRTEEPFRQLMFGVFRFRQNAQGTFDKETLYGYYSVNFYDDEVTTEKDITLMFSSVGEPRFSYSVAHAFSAASPPRVPFDTSGYSITYPGFGLFVEGQQILMANYRDPSKDTDSLENMLEYVALDNHNRVVLTTPTSPVRS